MWGKCGEYVVKHLQGMNFLAILMQRVGVQQSRIISDRTF